MKFHRIQMSLCELLVPYIRSPRRILACEQPAVNGEMVWSDKCIKGIGKFSQFCMIFCVEFLLRPHSLVNAALEVMRWSNYKTYYINTLPANWPTHLFLWTQQPSLSLQDGARPLRSFISSQQRAGVRRGSRKTWRPRSRTGPTLRWYEIKKVTS